MTADKPYDECYYSAQDGLRLYYRKYGEPGGGASPVLCLPGLTRNAKDFHRLALHLSKTRQVLCPDYRGRGLSAYDADARNYQPASYLNDLKHLLIVEGVHDLIVVGTSLGGLLALGLNVAIPGTINAIVLNDIGPEISAAGIERIRAYVSVDHPHEDWPSAVAELKAFMPNLPARNEREWQEVAEATWRRREDGLLHVDWDVALANNAAEPPAELLWRLLDCAAGLPLLVFRGELSDVLPKPALERMAVRHPNLRHRTIPKVGHAPDLAAEPALADVTKFIEEMDGLRSATDAGR